MILVDKNKEKISSTLVFSLSLRNISKDNEIRRL
tara:strand:- start:622 stop:723 length:102 start_codon:yes stop_codon:yes gene_type:complete